jgi:hypothetical protein
VLALKMACWMAAAASEPVLAVSLQIRVADCPEAPPASWVAAHVESVRALLAPHGITVTAQSERFVPPRCEVITRQERDSFADAVAPPGVVTVLVVPRVQDLDVPSYDLRGVHWRAGGRRWIFLTARARPPVLAHELAHYFGLPHDPAGGNLMTPGPSSAAWRSRHPPRPFAPILTADQVRRLRAGISRFSSTRQIPDVGGKVRR